MQTDTKSHKIHGQVYFRFAGSSVLLCTCSHLISYSFQFPPSSQKREERNNKKTNSYNTPLINVVPSTFLPHFCVHFLHFPLQHFRFRRFLLSAFCFFYSPLFPLFPRFPLFPVKPNFPARPAFIFRQDLASCRARSWQQGP